MTAQRLQALLLCSALAACASTDVGNPITAEVQFAGYETDGPEAGALVLDSGITVESALIKVKSFKLDRSTSCDDGSTDFEDTILVDLLAQTMSATALWDGESDTYCRLRLKFTTDAVDSAAPGWSVMVTGTTSEGEAFTATVDAEDTLSLDKEHPRYATFRSNIATSARLFHDSDQNGVLDTEEIARSLAVGGN